MQKPVSDHCIKKSEKPLLEGPFSKIFQKISIFIITSSLRSQWIDKKIEITQKGGIYFKRKRSKYLEDGPKKFFSFFKDPKLDQKYKTSKNYAYFG